MASALALHEVVVPSPGSPVVLTCVTDQNLRARVSDAIRDRGTLRFVPTFGELLASLRTSSVRTNTVVIPPRDASGREATSAVREIAAHFPGIAIVAYCRSGVESSADIRGLAVAGVHEFLFAGDDSRLAVRAVLEGAQRECAAEQVMTVLARTLPPKVHPIVEACLARPSLVTTVEHLAAALGVHRKTLYNLCVGAGAPPPAELVTWCRLSLVAYVLSQTGRTVESLANEFEFASPTALRNVIKRYSGLRASDIRASGGVECVIRALRARVAKLRPQLHVM
jgi:AraC-like DNA-binding protein